MGDLKRVLAVASISLYRDFPLHNFQKWDCRSRWAYSFWIEEVWSSDVKCSSCIARNMGRLYGGGLSSAMLPHGLNWSSIFSSNSFPLAEPARFSPDSQVYRFHHFIEATDVKGGLEGKLGSQATYGKVRELWGGMVKKTRTFSKVKQFSTQCNSDPGIQSKPLVLLHQHFCHVRIKSQFTETYYQMDNNNTIFCNSIYFMLNRGQMQESYKLINLPWLTVGAPPP